MCGFYMCVFLLHIFRSLLLLAALPPSSFSVAPVGLAVKCKLCDCNNNGLIDAHDSQRESPEN